MIRARVIHHLHIIQRAASVESAVRRLRSGWILEDNPIFNSKRKFQTAEMLTSQRLSGGKHFGTGVSISDLPNEWIAVGAPDADGPQGEVGQGSVSIFRPSTAKWSHSQTLYAAGGKASDKFGFSARINGAGTHLVVGAPGEVRMIKEVR